MSALLALLAAPLWAAPASPTAQPAAPSPKPAVTKDEDSSRVEQARSYFASGNEHYAAGRYREAIQHFQAGYALVPRPNFLVNLGQAYRKLGDLTHAKEAYLAYVRALPQDSPLRDQALQVLAEIEVQLQETQAQQPRPLTKPVAGNGQLQSSAATGGGGERSGGDPGAAAGEATPRSRALAWVVAGTGVALAGGGVFFQLRARSASDELEGLARAGEPFDPGLEDRGWRDQRIATGLLVGAGVALTAAVTMLVLLTDGDGATGSTAERAAGGASESGRRAAGRKAPRLTLRPAGAGLQLRF